MHKASQIQITQRRHWLNQSRALLFYFKYVAYCQYFLCGIFRIYLNVVFLNSTAITTLIEIRRGPEKIARGPDVARGPPIENPCFKHLLKNLSKNNIRFQKNIGRLKTLKTYSFSNFIKSFFPCWDKISSDEERNPILFFIVVHDKAQMELIFI